MISKMPPFQFSAIQSPTNKYGEIVVGKTGLRMARAETWRKWSRLRTAYIWEAVALHCQLDPDFMTIGSITSNEKVTSGSAAHFYQERSFLAHRHLLDGSLTATGKPGVDLNLWSVRLCDYAKWSKELDMPLPSNFPTATTMGPDNTSKWPWGSHDTNLLRLFAEAGKYWKPLSEGGNYDPSDPTTAPTNDQIVAWLIKKGVSTNISKAMATILRADEMPSGPRSSKSK